MSSAFWTRFARCPYWDMLLAVRCNTPLPAGNVRNDFGLMTAGGGDIADIEKFSGDAMFRHLVGLDLDVSVLNGGSRRIGGVTTSPAFQIDVSSRRQLFSYPLAAFSFSVRTVKNVETVETGTSRICADKDLHVRTVKNVETVETVATSSRAGVRSKTSKLSKTSESPTSSQYFTH